MYGSSRTLLQSGHRVPKMWLSLPRHRYICLGAPPVTGTASYTHRFLHDGGWLKIVFEHPRAANDPGPGTQ